MFQKSQDQIHQQEESKSNKIPLDNVLINNRPVALQDSNEYYNSSSNRVRTEEYRPVSVKNTSSFNNKQKYDFTSAVSTLPGYFNNRADPSDRYVNSKKIEPAKPTHILSGYGALETVRNQFLHF